MASTCSRCGTTDDTAEDDGLPVGWSLSSSRRGIDRLCHDCTRTHVRDIEAKLDESWWG